MYDGYAEAGVSTRSRPKAAGPADLIGLLGLAGFNTQPPEGSWKGRVMRLSGKERFQHAAARRQLVPNSNRPTLTYFVSTRSRPKAAGWDSKTPLSADDCVSTRSRPKAAGPTPEDLLKPWEVSTRSRPKAAGLTIFVISILQKSFNTQPPEGSWCRTSRRCRSAA